MWGRNPPLLSRGFTMVEKKKKKNTTGTIVVQAIVAMENGNPINIHGRPLPVGQTARLVYNQDTKQGIDNLIKGSFVIEVEDIGKDISIVPTVE